MFRRKPFDWVIRVTLSAVLLVQLALPALADEAVDVRNVRFEVRGELVYVYFDLLGDAQKAHRVNLYLRRESEPTFVYRPQNVTGEAGTIVFPASGKRITWEFTKEFPEGLQGSDYYFEVEAEAPETSGVSPWVFIGGGVALIGGVVALVLAGGGDEAPPPPATGFPQPPGRP